MITVREIQGNEENFNWWLTIMPDILMNISLIPRDVRERLSYSLESLDVLEKYLIENYELNTIRNSENKVALDFFVRYIGETFRKNLKDIIWELETREGWFGFGFPLLTKRDNIPFTKVSPYSWVGGVLDRKTGDYLSTILRNIMKDEIKLNKKKDE